MADVLRLDTQACDWRLVDGEVVGLDLRAEEYFSVSGSAVPLWELLVAGTDEAALVHELRSRYALEPERAAVDVRAFLDALRGRGLLADTAP